MLLEECDEIKHKIAELKNQRLCQSCGKSVAKDALFCQFCGSKLPERKETPKPNPEDHSATAEGTAAASSEWSYDGLSEKDRDLVDMDNEREVPQVSVNETPLEAPNNPVEEAKQQIEFERERKRQEELDRLIETWKENVTPTSSAQPTSTYTNEEHNHTYGDTKTCANCGETITSHHKWCPNCGSQQ
ncbi:Double zinc ribbon [compost metagenome]